jgi:ABC-type dipeptide/oligopeptide/nickel transport system permease component
MTMMKTNYCERLSKRALLVRRLLPILPMWFVITVIVFLTARCIGNTAINLIIIDYYLTETSSIKYDMKNPILNEFGLDQPIHFLYLRWMGLLKQADGQYRGVLQGDLGHSIWEER